MGGKSGTLEERFWPKVAKRGPDECWEWTANKVGHDRVSHGYGRIVGSDGRMLLAHRVSWELQNGPIPEGLKVLHHCDNPPCVNPKHLFLGTIQDNADDMTSKNRQRGAPGERNAQAKLTDQDVRDIRVSIRKGLSQRQVAKNFNIDQAVVGRIMRGTAWCHVD